MGYHFTKTSTSVEETQTLARALASCVCPSDCFVLSGDLGAGKTHFTQGFAAGLGITRPVASPTFNIVLEYPEVQPPLYHFDVYRLDEASELEDIDFYALVEDDGVSLIEWGEKFDEALDEADVHIVIKLDEGNLGENEMGENESAASDEPAGSQAASDEPARIITFMALSPRGNDIIAALERVIKTRN